jgi:di/tricarboxylate transporter
MTMKVIDYDHEYDPTALFAGSRFLQETEEEQEPPVPKWEPILTVITIVLMFAVLMTDKIATESVMLTALCVFYLSGIIDVKEALTGFSSQGLLTVLILFVVAEGLNKTGALNWYVGKLFGRPKTLAGAQARLMIPITALSGFINDTPLVTVTLPIVIQWCKRVNLNPRFAMMPLSFASLLGGKSLVRNIVHGVLNQATQHSINLVLVLFSYFVFQLLSSFIYSFIHCPGVITIIGTSTNLIIVGLLIEAYPDDPFFQSMPLFGIAIYGVPVAFLGVAYVILFTPLLLARNHSTVVQDLDAEQLLLRARVTQYSPAADRTVLRSGLRDTGGVYLVRVKRHVTGNYHNAVGPEFVIGVGDILYFAGLLETFADFCEEHGLELMTNELEANIANTANTTTSPTTMPRTTAQRTLHHRTF